MARPSIGRIVHYVSYGTPGGEYSSTCRAAVVTALSSPAGVDDATPERVDLAVLNPAGMFFNSACPFDEGDGNPGDPECVNAPHEDMPFRYCNTCDWSESHLVGGTWHWPERVKDEA
jgi:hypothetical protein